MKKTFGNLQKIKFQMKRKTINTPAVDRKSKQENLPLLRGMFVGPDKTKREKTLHPKMLSSSGVSDDELFLTAEQGYYLGE